MLIIDLTFCAHLKRYIDYGLTNFIVHLNSYTTKQENLVEACIINIVSNIKLKFIKKYIELCCQQFNLRMQST